MASLTLEIFLPPDHQPQTIADNPSASQLAFTIRRLAWDDLTFVVLKYDDENWIELSGALTDDFGLSARYWNDGIEHVAARPPADLDEGTRLLEHYRRGDSLWKQMISWEAAGGDGPARPAPARIRLRGLAILLVSAAAYWLLFGYVLRSGLDAVTGVGTSTEMVYLLGAPGAGVLYGTVELILGRPFMELSDAWDALRGWQRGVLGVVIVAAALGLLIGGLVAAGSAGLI
ncbi:MAG: hypothetical protein HKO62_02325 [Gammaproteobacteria bacterium]|nr:hypothetical protein [Gammaproteobacteria bacterium]